MMPETLYREGYATSEKPPLCFADQLREDLAAWLEAHTEVAGRGILIDEDTQRALTDRVHTEALGAVPFKGKTAAVEILAVATGQPA